MQVNLLAHLRALNFEPLYPRTYIERIVPGLGGAVPLLTQGTLEIVIGNHDFCVTDLFVLAKSIPGFAEGFDLTLRNSKTDYNYSNVPSPLDTGAVVARETIPYQTLPGMPSMFELPFILNAGDRIEATLFARYVAAGIFIVVLNGYVLNTVGAPIPYLPKWYHFNGPVNDLAATTFNVNQEVTINGPSDLLCFSMSSNWDVGVPNLDIRESVRNELTGNSYSKKVVQYGGCFLRPDDTVAEPVFPIPFKIPNGSVLMRNLSNFGAVPERRPEFTVFGYFDQRDRE